AREAQAENVLQQGDEFGNFQVIPEAFLVVGQAVLIAEFQTRAVVIVIDVQAELEVHQQPELCGDMQGFAQGGAAEQGKTDNPVGGQVQAFTDFQAQQFIGAAAIESVMDQRVLIERDSALGVVQVCGSKTSSRQAVSELLLVTAG